MADGAPEMVGRTEEETTGPPEGESERGTHRTFPNPETDTGCERAESGNASRRVIWSLNKTANKINRNHATLGEEKIEQTTGMDRYERGGPEGGRAIGGPGTTPEESAERDQRMAADEELSDINSDDSIDQDLSDGEIVDARTRFIIPIRVDLQKNQWNPEGDAGVSARKIFAIIKHTDKSAALRGDYGPDGKRRRFREISDIPRGGNIGMRVKTKQHRKQIRTLFGQIETTIQPKEIRELDGIKKINTPTIIFRFDQYDGEKITSVGWVFLKHPYYTHTETFLRELTEKAKKINISEAMTERYKRQLPEYDPRKTLAHKEVPLPYFHLTTEEKIITSNNKRFSTKVIAVHTSESAAQMISHIMARLEEEEEVTFIPSSFRHEKGKDAELKLLQKHKEGIKNVVCLTVYDIKEGMMGRQRKDKAGKQHTLEEYIKKGMRLKTIERTNATKTEGKYFFLVDRKNSQFARQKILHWLPRVYQKYMRQNEITDEGQLPRMANSIGYSPGIGALNKKLMELAYGTEYTSNSEDEIDKINNNKNEREGDDEKVITTKKQRLNYEEALRQDIPYTNHHYGETPQGKSEASEETRRTKEKSTDFSKKEITEIVMQEITGIIPKVLTKEKAQTNMEWEVTTSKLEKKVEAILEETKSEKNEAKKLYESMNKWMEEQHRRAEKTQAELDKVKEMTNTSNKEQTKRIEKLTKTIENLEQRVDQSNTTMEERLESRLKTESIDQDKRFERLILLQSARASEDIKKISMNTNMMIAKYHADTRATVESEAQKVFRQVAQTALDVDGIKNKLHTLDMDLQATGEVAYTTSQYLSKATEDYKAPDTVEYETIVSPEPTPSKKRTIDDNEIEKRPPFGEAQKR